MVYGVLGEPAAVPCTGVRTKNVCDRMFNTLKEDYHSNSIYTRVEPIPKLNLPDRVMFREAIKEDCFGHNTFLNPFYSKFINKGKKNYLFNATCENSVGTQLLVDLRERDLVEHKLVKHKTIEFVCFWER